MEKRKIKFRVWDYNFNRWLDEETLIDLNGQLCVNDCVTMKGDFEIQQYIGKNDKNGKEIYEGDIFIPDGWALDSKQAMHVVVYEPTIASYFTIPLTKEAKESSVCLQGFGNGGTVIGNVCENRFIGATFDNVVFTSAK